MNKLVNQYVKNTNVIPDKTYGTSEGIEKYIKLTTKVSEHKIDLEDITGEYYIGVFCSYRTIQLYDVWLEK